MATNLARAETIKKTPKRIFSIKVVVANHLLLNEKLCMDYTLFFR